MSIERTIRRMLEDNDDLPVVTRKSKDEMVKAILAIPGVTAENPYSCFYDMDEGNWQDCPYSWVLICLRAAKELGATRDMGNLPDWDVKHWNAK